MTTTTEAGEQFQSARGRDYHTAYIGDTVVDVCDDCGLIAASVEVHDDYHFALIGLFDTLFMAVFEDDDEDEEDQDA